MDLSNNIKYTEFTNIKNINLQDRIITEPNFLPISPSDMNLLDLVAVYNDGRNWKVIPIDILTRYVVFYDKHFDKIKNKKGENIVSDISITFCPYTFAAVIYFKKYAPTNKLYRGNIVLKDLEDGLLVPQIIGNKFVRKKEIKLMTLRNVISNFPDCSYFNNNIDKLPRIVSDEYITNKDVDVLVDNINSKYHPKTLVYGIEYKSIDTTINDYKYSVIIGADASNSINKDSLFDYVKNGYNDYFNLAIDKIRDKGGVIIPCFWFCWMGIHENSKIVKL